MPPIIDFSAKSCLSTSFFLVGKQGDKSLQCRQIAVRGRNGKYCVRSDVSVIDPDFSDIVAAKADFIWAVIKDHSDNYAGYTLEFLEAVHVLRAYEAEQPARLRVTRAVKAGETHVNDGVPINLSPIPRFEGQF